MYELTRKTGGKYSLRLSQKNLQLINRMMTIFALGEWGAVYYVQFYLKRKQL
jgi:hypothetical protein